MNGEIFWQAVKANDRRFDGIFWTCVKTTKIFCRPSCPARLPKRENIYFVDSFERAEADGYRACRRCAPKNIDAVDPQVRTVLKACELLAGEENITLESLGAELGLSPSHLQRTFKRIVGISPKKYAEAKRLGKFKTEIRKGSGVTEAIYESGFGSSSRLYENVSDKLGMTPNVYKQGGAGMLIRWTIADCDLGKLLVARTFKGVCAVRFGDTSDELLADLKNEYRNAEITADEGGLQEYVGAILEHLAGKRTDLELPFDVRATAFQMKVWEILRKIPYGETVSYKEVAERLGNQKAVRAVASACARNQVALVIPCHRVVGSDGSLSGYRWGIERKKKLLEKEKGN
jgi:AraC family transcriptional regulator, regulatory protein of adaptative response / methylated-DNA-[protein]-cysteine methyltransferase